MIGPVLLIGLVVILLLEREPRTPDQKHIDRMARDDRRRQGWTA